MMEVQVASSTPARSVPLILTGQLQAQLPENDKPLEKVLTIFRVQPNSKQKQQKQQKQPPTTTDQNGYC